MATLVRILGDIGMAEDAVQDAFAIAMSTWPDTGMPDNPGAWITTTARNRAVDRIRRDRRGRELLGEVAVLHHDAPGEVAVVQPVADDMLRLVFTSCHPILSPQAQVALTLRLVIGLSTADVARALVVTEPTMAQRLVRAKRRIRAADIGYRAPDPDELPTRLPAVLATVLLTYNAEGADLRADAVHLARTLAALLPDEPEVTGLLALLLLTEARWPARRDAAGRLVLLADQDRSLWRRDLVDEGHELVRQCLRRNRPDPYQLQAAISAVHTDAATFADTDWHQVVALYDQLLAQSPGPVVALNRAIAVGEVDGPGHALELVEELDLDGYQPFHATRADLLARVGRRDAARGDYARAADLATDPAVARHLREAADGLASIGDARDVAPDG